MTFLVFALIAFGLWYTVGGATITEGVREALVKVKPLKLFVEMVECPGCFGFWTGLAASFWTDVGVSLYPLPKWASMALLTCATNLVLARFAGAPK